VKSLQDVVEGGLCAGCGLCEAISGSDNVSMAIDERGFWRPVVHHWTPEMWDQIRRVCPGMVVEQDGNRSARRPETMWGPVQMVRAGHSTDETVRWRGSSGGALSAILIHLLETGKVDFVLHAGVAESDPILPVMRRSCTREEVVDNAGSRYAPTAPLAVLPNLLGEDEGAFAFVGKPCDVAGLRAYVELNPRVNERLVAVLSFFCAGVPSLWATYDLLDALGVAAQDVRRLRYRGCGWPGRAVAVDSVGREYTMSYEQSWGKLLGPSRQFRCKICPDGVGELADIVCADAWVVKEGCPSFEEAQGRSLVLARTATGRQHVLDSERGGYLVTTGFQLEDLGACQPYQLVRRRSVAARMLALWLMRRPIPRYRGFHLLRNALDGGPRLFVEQFGGMLARMVEARQAECTASRRSQSAWGLRGGSGGA
jgi:coenzyme F420 hydrogenase subunit beta